MPNLTNKRKDVIDYLKQHTSEINNEDYTFLNDNLPYKSMADCLAVMYEELGITDVYEYVSSDPYAKGELVSEKNIPNLYYIVEYYLKSLSKPLHLKAAIITDNLCTNEDTKIIVDTLYAQNHKRDSIIIKYVFSDTFEINTLISNMPICLVTEGNLKNKSAIKNIRCPKLILGGGNYDIDNFITTSREFTIMNSVVNYNLHIKNLIAPKSTVRLLVENASNSNNITVDNLVANTLIVGCDKYNENNNLEVLNANIKSLQLVGSYTHIACDSNLENIKVVYVDDDVELKLPSSLKNKDLEITNAIQNRTIEKTVEMLNEVITWV